MSSHLYITLRPFDYYFFGSEETFNSSANAKQNFQVKSNRIPQQTGLLGLLRHIMLTAGHKNIGKSFDGSHQDFGLISSISPIFLQHRNGDRFLPAPNLFSSDKKAKMVHVNSDKSSYSGGKWNDFAYLADGYDPKKILCSHWINIRNGELISEEILFLSNFHTGIDKQKRMKDIPGDGGFYRQEFISLHADFSFAFIAHFTEKIPLQNLPYHLPFGGEKRLFSLKYIPTGKDSWQNMEKDYQNIVQHFFPEKPCILLLSDALASNQKDLLDAIRFGIMEEVPFRNLITPVDTTNFGSFPDNEKEGKATMYKQKKLTYLLKKGSVLWFEKDNKDAITKCLKQPFYKAIGYNHFINLLTK